MARNRSAAFAITATAIFAIAAAAPLPAQMQRQNGGMIVGIQPPAKPSYVPPATAYPPYYPYLLPPRIKKVRCEQDHIGPCPDETADAVVVQDTPDYSVVIVPKKKQRCEQDHIAPCE